MLAIEELVNEVHRARRGRIAALIVGEQDCDRLRDQVPMVHDPMSKTEGGAAAMLAGVRVYEDPGLPPGNYEVVRDEETLRRRLHLIKLGLTVTPDGMMKPADWWLRAVH